MGEVSQDRLRRALRCYRDEVPDSEEVEFYHRCLLGWDLGGVVVVMPWPEPGEVPTDPLVALEDIEKANNLPSWELTSAEENT